MACRQDLCQFGMPDLGVMYRSQGRADAHPAKAAGDERSAYHRQFETIGDRCQEPTVLEPENFG